MSKYESHKQEVLKKIKEAKKKTLHAVGVFGISELVISPKMRVKTGNLRNSYTYEIDLDEEKVTFGTPVEYAPYVELGTSRSKAYPHFEITFIENADRIKNLIKEMMAIDD
mgnify:CR=1 FL=1